jgi:hypothetical protein
MAVPETAASGEASREGRLALAMTPQQAGAELPIQRCEIDTVRAAAPDPVEVASAALEAPVPGDRLATWAIPCAGHVVGGRGPVRQVWVGQGDARWALPVHDHRADVAHDHPDREWARHAGFSGAVNSLRLRPQFELDVTAELAHGAAARLATVAGRRARLRAGYDPQLQPLIVTTLGRTGSTWLIHLLAGHPMVTAYRPFSFEPRAATYWIDILTSLSEPASYTQQVEGEVHYPSPWWLGSGTRMTSEVLPDAELARWLGSDHVADLAAFAQQRIDAVYLHVAALTGDRPRYFAEKCLPERNVPQLLHELYPEAREIFLVRDFRDMFCSIRAFNEKRGSAAFGFDGAGAEETYVVDVLAPSVENLLDEWRDRRGEAQLVRYEDLMLNPAATVRAVLEGAGLDSSDDVVDAMVSSAAEPIPGMAMHTTAAAGPHASVGRWQRELEPRLRHLCDEALGPALGEFGYAPAATGGRAG